jgi:hypothetical protein
VGEPKPKKAAQRTREKPKLVLPEKAQLRLPFVLDDD